MPPSTHKKALHLLMLLSPWLETGQLLQRPFLNTLPFIMEQYERLHEGAKDYWRSSLGQKPTVHAALGQS